jgi:hypothetical protein
MSSYNGQYSIQSEGKIFRTVFLYCEDIYLIYEKKE